MKQFAILFNILLISSIVCYSSPYEQKYKEGLQLYKAKNYAEAIKRFDESIAEYPMHFNSYLKKSYAYYKLEEYQKALESIEQGFEFELKDSRYFYMKAQFYDKLENNEMALYYINMAIKFNPDRLTYYAFRGNLHMIMQNYNKAIDDFNIVQVYDPKEYKVYYNKGLALNNTKRLKDACLEWAYAQEKNKNCKKMVHYRCAKIDLRPFTRKQPTGKIADFPVFVVDGDSSFNNYVLGKMHYPQKSIINSEEGCVIVQLDLNESDYSKNCTLLNSVSKTLDSLAMKMVSQSSEYWSRKNLTIENSKIIVPIRFKISEPVYKERAILDSINAVKNKNAEAELAFVEEYLKYNPYQLEMRKRFNHLIFKLNKKENYLVKPDFSKMAGVWMDEICNVRQYYKIYCNQRYELCDKSEASFFILSNSYILSDSWAAYTMRTIDGVLYAEGVCYNKMQEGKFTEYYPNGTVCLDMNFQSGKPVNYLNYYYPNGNLKHRIYLNKWAFSFINYNGEFGNSLLTGNNIIWEYTNMREGNLDTNVIVGNILVKEKMETWKLYKGQTLACEEVFKKDKLVSCRAFDDGPKNPDGSCINSDYFMPMSAIFLRETKYSTNISENTVRLLNNLAPDF